MTGSNPIVGQTPPSGGSSSSNPAPSNQLNPNAFITLLTTQLQAQDPLNPLDPNQLVDELTNMNSFEQLLQIRQDLDALVGAAQAGPSTGSGTGAGSGAGTGSSSAAAAASILAPASNVAPGASQFSALSNALVSNSFATLSSRLNSKSPVL
jgi:flagellar basal-body rod modification protein FlgD